MESATTWQRNPKLLDYLIRHNQGYGGDEFQAALQLWEFVIESDCCVHNGHTYLQRWGAFQLNIHFKKFLS